MTHFWMSHLMNESDESPRMSESRSESSDVLSDSSAKLESDESEVNESVSDQFSFTE